MHPSASIFVSGHRGLVGSAIIRYLRQRGYSAILTAKREQLDLRDQSAVESWFAENRPQYVIHVAGKVGGIQANSSEPADFIYDNLLIHATVLRAAWRFETKKLLYLGSSCIYPRDCPQPIKEEYLLSGPLEKTNEPYAISKIAGLVSCQAYRQQHGCNFISAMPTNSYGPNDNFDPDSSHVLPALIQKFHQAKVSGEDEVVIWGTGKPRREFLHADDLASACVYLINHYDQTAPINVGTGQDVTILTLAELVRDIVYPEAKITFDVTKPNGTPRKLLDVSRLHALGWRHSIDLRQGIHSTYDWYVQSLTRQEIRQVDMPIGPSVCLPTSNCPSSAPNCH